MLQPNEVYIAECNRLLTGRTIKRTFTNDEGKLINRSVHVPRIMYVHYHHGGSKSKHGTAVKFRAHHVLVTPIGAKLKIRKKGIKVDYSEIFRISSHG